MENQTQNSAPNNVPDKVSGFFNTPDETANFDPADIQANKNITILSYIGFLFLIPLFATNNSRFARYHANQGLLLFIVMAGIGVVNFIFGMIRGAMLLVGAYRIVTVITSLISGALWLCVVGLAIIGIINVINGKAKRLPLIGKFNLIKY